MQSFFALTTVSEKIKYIREKVPFFSVEYKEDFLYFYCDGTQGLKNPENKLLKSLLTQYRYDEYTEAFFSIEGKIRELQQANLDIKFTFDTDDLLLEFLDND